MFYETNIFEKVNDWDGKHWSVWDDKNGIGYYVKGNIHQLQKWMHKKFPDAVSYCQTAIERKRVPWIKL